jgi:hypothetical protein
MAEEQSKRPLPADADLHVSWLDPRGGGSVEGGGGSAADAAADARVSRVMSADDLLREFTALGEAFFFHQLAHWKETASDGRLAAQFGEALQRLHVRRPRSAIQFLRCYEPVHERAVVSEFPPVTSTSMAYALLACRCGASFFSIVCSFYSCLLIIWLLSIPPRVQIRPRTARRAGRVRECDLDRVSLRV